MSWAAEPVAAGKVALVTGASRGLGQAVARMFARHGATTIAVAEVASELEHTAAVAQADGAPLTTHLADLTDDAAIHEMIATVMRQHGRLDVLVNAAAMLPLVPFEQTTPDIWDRTLRLNLRAPYLASYLAYPIMKAQGHGSIINVSSRAGYLPFADETAYCTAKYGIEGFSYALAIEAKAHNIAVNAITPGSDAATATIKIKPTGLTQAQYDALPAQEQARYLGHRVRPGPGHPRGDHGTAAPDAADLDLVADPQPVGQDRAVADGHRGAHHAQLAALDPVDRPQQGVQGRYAARH